MSPLCQSFCSFTETHLYNDRQNGLKSVWKKKPHRSFGSFVFSVLRNAKSKARVNAITASEKEWNGALFPCNFFCQRRGVEEKSDQLFWNLSGSTLISAMISTGWICRQWAKSRTEIITLVGCYRLTQRWMRHGRTCAQAATGITYCTGIFQEYSCCNATSLVANPPCWSSRYPHEDVWDSRLRQAICSWCIVSRSWVNEYHLGTEINLPN